MPKFRVICDFQTGEFFAGIGTDAIDQYTVEDFFPRPISPDDALQSWEIVEETDDPTGCPLQSAQGNEPRSMKLDAHRREPTEEEIEENPDWGGTSVVGEGSIAVIVEAESEDDIDEDLLVRLLPEWFWIWELDDFDFGVNESL
ncbi:MAG: hypothetical protein KDB02_03400 [Acidimicrobiales bacterium]|nr:hypothetical protein [Acidimicrobiales bacterium]